MIEQHTQPPRLLPTMGAGMLALYGLGSMLGAGVYGLVGKAAGMLGGMARQGLPPPIKLPIIVPILGGLICAMLLVVRAATGEIVAPLIAGCLLLLIVVLYLATRHSHRADETEPLAEIWMEQAYAT